MSDSPDKEMTANEFHQFQEIVANVLGARQAFFRQFDNNQKDLYDECGYESTDSLQNEDYLNQFERNPIANRVVQVAPTECWKVLPTIFESEDQNVDTPFEKAFADLPKQLQDGSYYQPSEPSEGSPVWDMLSKADILSGIGQYGGIFLGFDDGKDLNKPVKAKTGRKLLFMQPLDANRMRVNKFNHDVTSPRYGAPEEYLVTFGTANIGDSSVNSVSGSINRVHWTRVLHLADNTLGNPWLGLPRMLPVWNRLKDCEKLFGGSAEMYWKGAFPGLSFETHPQLGGDVEINQVEVKQSVQNYFSKLQRYLALTGMTAKSLAPQVVDPKVQIDVQVDAICIQLRVPKRVFIGSERGELSSTQDEKMWDERLVYRQKTYLTPYMIVPFVNRLIQFGVLPKPKSFGVTWPDMDSLTDTEKATIAVQRTQALGQFTQDDIEPTVPLMEFLTLILKMRKGDAISIVNAATKLKSNSALRISTKPEPKLPALAGGKSPAKVKSAGAKQERNPVTKVKQQAKRGPVKSQQPR